MVLVRKILLRNLNYHVFRCFPDFEGGGYRMTYQDVRGPIAFTTLNGGVFRWVLNIHLGYLVFWQSEKCFIEPYQQFRFSRQFWYDQLYVGNPNPQLALIDNLYEGARAWYYSVAGGAGATFKLPHKTPNSYTTMGFCSWYHATSQIPEYKMYTSCLKEIRKVYKSKRGSKMTYLKGIEEYLSCEQAAVGDEEVEATEEAKEKEARATKTREERAARK